MPRTLSLTRGTLAEPVPEDLARIVGAEPVGPLVDEMRTSSTVTATSAPSDEGPLA